MRGLPGEASKLWAAGRGEGAGCSTNTESCQLKQPNFGLPAEGKSRWCAACAKGHAGAVNLNHTKNAKKCEGCGLKSPSISLPAEGKKRRWCTDCAPKAAKPVRWRKKAEGSAQKKPKASDPPLTSVRGQILPGDGNPY